MSYYCSYKFVFFFYMKKCFHTLGKLVVSFHLNVEIEKLNKYYKKTRNVLTGSGLAICNSRNR